MDTPTLDHPRSRTVLRTVKLLVGGYLTISVATLAAIVVLRDHHSLVTPPVWARSCIVVVAAVLTTSFTVNTARGSSRSYLRLRIASGIMLVAIAVIVALPGDFPLWLKIEQGVCGLLLLGVVVLINGRHMRSVFAE